MTENQRRVGTVQLADEERAREEFFEVYLEGYKLGYGVEELKNIHLRTARERFERWWEVNRA